MTDSLRARRDAALRLPPLADGRRDPLMERESLHRCRVCQHTGTGMVFLFGQWMCRDRVDCYQRFRSAP